MRTPMNILLVEDNDVDVDILRRALKKIGAPGDLVRAKDGREALDMLNAPDTHVGLQDPFMILLDINMPGMNGHEFLDALRKTPDIADSRVIVFTTSDNPTDVVRAYAKHAVGYVVKPNTSVELREALQSIWDFWDRCTHPSTNVMN